MSKVIQNAVYSQLGASIDMLEDSISLCPAELWDTEKQFWYVSYHTLFWLHYYLDLDPKNYQPPEPFTLSEFDTKGLMPPKTYSKEELLSFLELSRAKCRDLSKQLTEELAGSRWVNDWKDLSVLEMAIYNTRHVQHHLAQLNLILRQEIDDAPKWVSVCRQKLDA